MLMTGLRDRALAVWDKPRAKKLRRVVYHVIRGAKKFVIGSGNAAWVVGTTMLVMVMPLVFEIDREQQLIEYEGGMAPPPILMK
jgi:import receptor subunit TOM22